MIRRPTDRLSPDLIPEDIRVTDDGPPEHVPTVYPPGEAPDQHAEDEGLLGTVEHRVLSAALARQDAGDDESVAETLEVQALAESAALASTAGLPDVHELDDADAPQIEPATRRLFFALWPGAELAQRMLHVSHSQIARVPCTPVQGADLHLTLKFLGDVTPEQREALIALCNGMRAHAFSLRLAPLEYWSGSKSIVCASYEITQPQAARVLVERLTRESAQLGLKLDSQRWRPHVTLARQVREAPEGLKPLPKMEWKVRRLCLAESLPQPGAGQLRYRVLGRWALV